MSESDNAAEWVRIMAQRYRWGDDLDAITAEAEELTPREREGVQRIFEQLFFEGKLNYRWANDGKAKDAE
jgi:hypothetical protein